MTDQPSPNANSDPIRHLIPIDSGTLFRLKAAPQYEVFWLIHTHSSPKEALVALSTAPF